MFSEGLWEDPLEKEMAPHSSILAWEITWTEEPGGAAVHRVEEPDTAEPPTYNSRGFTNGPLV